MANNTKKAIKDAKDKRRKYYDDYIAKFCLLFHNSVKVEGSDIPKRYLLKTLLTKGAIAYDKETGLYLPFTAEGLDIYGLPLNYILIGYNGFVVTRKPEEVVILRANDLRYPYIYYFEMQASKLVDYDMAIEQNLEAVKTQSIAEVESQDTLLSLANEVEAKRLGATVIYKAKGISDGLKVQPTNAEYLVDKLLLARREIYNETLATIGISVANTDKRERVQVEEIRASEGYGIDTINTLVETFNYDAEVGNLPIRLVGNTELIKENEMEKNLKERAVIKE